MLHKAVFLDRDGTVAFDVNNTQRVEDFQLIPRAGEAIRLFNRAGFLVVIATNQSGIARGYFTEKTVGAIHIRMSNDLERQGGRIDAIYYCPHHPDDGCCCRKPQPGMLKQASEDMKIDLGSSFLVGDRNSDIVAAQAVGCTAVLVDTGPPPTKKAVRSANYFAPDLYAAAHWILGQ